ncbi:MAG: hypothetical protein ACYC7J_17160 [Syntrophales bacterium]
MKKALLKNGIFLLLIALSLVAAGCGSSGGGAAGTPQRTVTLAYDSDNDGVPDIFDDYPDDAAGYAYAAYDGSSDSIFSAPSTLRGTIGSADTINEFPVRVEAGRTYSLVFTNPRKLDTRAVTFTPDVAVYTGSDEKLPLELSVVGNSHAIILSFTSNETGTHYITVRNAEANSEGATHTYRFDFIEDPAKQGMQVLFKAQPLASGGNTLFDTAAGGGYTYTLKDILFLRHELEPYIDETASDGSPKTFRNGARDAFTAAVAQLARVNDAPVCTPQTDLSSTIEGVPWNNKYSLGYSVDATTGLPPEGQVQAIAAFDLATPTGSTETETHLHFIESDQQYSSEIEMSFDGKLSAFGGSVEASSSYAKKYSYSETDITVAITFYVRETNYRKYGPQDGKYVFTPDAKNLADTDPAHFRDTYGDYFIAGAKYGAKYIATFHIHTTSASDTTTIRSKISEAWKSFGASEEFKAEFKKATQGRSVDFDRTTRGGDPTKLSAGTSVDDVLGDLNKFIANCTPQNRAELYAYLYRFDQIQQGIAADKRIPSRVNINSCVFSAARDLSDNYLALAARNNVIASLDSQSFQAGIKDSYAAEYRTLMNDINDHKQTIFGDKDQIAAYGGKVKAALDKFSNLIDRYYFTQKLLAAARSFPSSTGGSDIRSGFDGYNLSVAVNNDIQPQYWKGRYEESWHVGWRNWYPNWKPGTDYRVCFIQIWSWASHDDWWDQYYPSLSGDHLDFHFKSGYDRGGDWQLWAKGVNLGPGAVNYPFMWIH